MEEPPSGGPTYRVDRSHCSNPQDELGQSPLGRTANPRGTVEAWVRAIASHGCQVHDASLETAVSDVADVFEKPYRYCRYRFLCGSNGFLRLIVCLRDSLARPSSARPLCD